MIAQERYAYILDALQHSKTVRAAKLAAKLGVSSETIRRDLEYLEKEHQLIRIHGGASILQYETKQPSYQGRASSNLDLKQDLSEIALQYVSEGTSIILDHSTTCAVFARELVKHFSNLTVVTNSLEVMNIFSDHPSHTLVSLGGIFDSSERCFVGSQAIQTVKNLNIDIAFVSFGGLSLGEGCTENTFNGAEILSAFIHSAQQKIALIDSTKFDHVTLVKVCDLSDLDVVITDCQILEKKNVLEKYRSSVEICLRVEACASNRHP